MCGGGGDFSFRLVYDWGHRRYNWRFLGCFSKPGSSEQAGQADQRFQPFQAFSTVRLHPNCRCYRQTPPVPSPAPKHPGRAGVDGWTGGGVGRTLPAWPLAPRQAWQGHRGRGPRLVLATRRLGRSAAVVLRFRLPFGTLPARRAPPPRQSPRCRSARCLCV